MKKETHVGLFFSSMLWKTWIRSPE
jgi:hypothetical protein